MIEISLSQNQVALVDDQDYDLVNQYTWYAFKCRNTYYATKNLGCVEGKWSRILMHRLIMGAQPGQFVDHKNGDGLDNRRENLRI